MTKLILKRNETFTLRIGWLEKGLNLFKENNDLFKDENANLILGLGTNMVKSLRYYMLACNLIEQQKTKYNLTVLGNCILKYDKFLDHDFTIGLIHYNLVKNDKLAKVYNDIFNSNITYFTKESILEYLNDYYRRNDFEYKISSLEDEVTVFINNYISNDKSNPEDNTKSIFSKLALLEYTDNKYKKRSLELNIFLVYLNIIDLVSSDSFNIDDYLKYKNNACNIFNYSKSMIYLSLEKLEDLGLVKIVKTAGLNTCQIIKRMNLEEVYESVIGE